MSRHVSWILPTETLLAFAMLVTTVHAQANQTLMRIARHAAVTPITSGTYVGTFNQANSALQYSSWLGDIACPLTLSWLDTSELWYSASNITSNVGSQTDYVNHQNNAAHGEALVVNAINWCQTVGSVGGCGWPLGAGAPFIMTRDLAIHGARGIVLAHEFGHTQGLAHEQNEYGAAALPNMIMDQNFLTSTNTGIHAAADCLVWREPFPPYTCPAPNTVGTMNHAAVCSDPNTGHALVAQPVATSRPTTGAVSEPDTDFSGVPIETLAGGVFLDRVPVEVEDYYGADDLKKVKQMLKDANSSAYSRTVVTLIGLLSSGDDSDVADIKAYSQRSSADVTAAYLALAYIVSRTGNQTALNILQAGTMDQSDDIQEAAVLGLALSGHASALKQLKTLTPKSARLKELVAFASDENQRVKKMGLRAYSHSAPEKEIKPSLENPQAGVDP